MSKSGGSSADSAPASTILVSWNRDGIEYRAQPERESWLSESGQFGADAELAMLLGQLEEEGFAEQDAGRVRLSWQDFYLMAASPEHVGSAGVLKLPTMADWRPEHVALQAQQHVRATAQTHLLAR
jgi:hypothetical protein